MIDLLKNVVINCKTVKNPYISSKFENFYNFFQHIIKPQHY